jgi:hypothetical protein
MRVECTECDFSRVINSEDEENPYEMVEMHGAESGHRLELSVVEE